MRYERRRRAADPRHQQAPVESVRRPGRPADSPDSPASRDRPTLPELSPVPFVGMALVACDFFLCASSALLTPIWVTILLVLVWAALLRVSIAWWGPAPMRIVVGSVALAVLWFVVVVSGGVWLGWHLR